MSSFLKGLFGAKEETGHVPAVETEAVPVDEPTPSFQTLTILDTRGVTPEERDRVAKAQQLLQSLPDTTPAEVKREIVEAALKAFGVSIEDIVSAARHEIDVLSGFIEEGEAAIAQLETQSNQRIADLERQIAFIREDLAKARKTQDDLARQARAVVDEVDPVLRFFIPGGPPGPPPRRAVPREDEEQKSNEVG
ncbi:MAG TPA: hypothetical protein VFB62_04235 [Polyangiaceae bacterium]|nr:hypothetical protein [Polyangiaceae bacterium]